MSINIATTLVTVYGFARKLKGSASHYFWSNHATPLPRTNSASILRHLVLRGNERDAK